jgi:predicted TIM-barrel fold metal-dependent hydrolase
MPMALTIGARPTPDSFFRADARPTSGEKPGSDPALLEKQLFEPYDIRYAIMSPLEGFDFVQYGEFGLALARAMNDWMGDRWLDRDERLFASILVPQEDGIRAAKEIDRIASDRRYVQVMIISRTHEPLGHPKYWPVYEAAVRNRLPIAVHVGGYSRTPETGAGWPQFYVEHHVGWPYVYAAHIVSLVYSGIFAAQPEIRFVLEEAGFAWLPPLLSRMDRMWAAMREEVPHLTEPPSELVRRHFYFTTQPMEETEEPGHLLQMLDQLAMDDRIMFASDYPHWDFDAPDRSLPSGIKGERRAAILSGNADALYDFARRR